MTKINWDDTTSYTIIDTIKELKAKYYNKGMVLTDSDYALLLAETKKFSIEAGKVITLDIDTLKIVSTLLNINLILEWICCYEIRQRLGKEIVNFKAADLPNMQGFKPEFGIIDVARYLALTDFLDWV
jgi:hypothetical protein